MSARRRLIAALAEDSLGGIATLEDVARAEQLVDSHRTEVIAKAIGRLRAIPVTCTALTGPVWYGDGWNSAITVLEEIAEYQTPDDEAYPGELQRLRSLVLGLRVAALRKGDMAQVQWLLTDHEETRKKATGVQSATATPDFFQPDHTYRRDEWEFRCHGTGPHPITGERHAFGWKVLGADDEDIYTLHPTSLDAEAWDRGWTDVTEAGDRS